MRINEKLLLFHWKVVCAACWACWLTAPAAWAGGVLFFLAECKTVIATISTSKMNNANFSRFIAIGSGF